MFISTLQFPAFGTAGEFYSYHCQILIRGPPADNQQKKEDETHQRRGRKLGR